MSGIRIEVERARGAGNNSAVAHRHRLELLGSKTKQFGLKGVFWKPFGVPFAF